MLDEGNRVPDPALRMLNFGLSSLNPSKGGREHEVTNFINFCFCSSENSDTTFQKLIMIGSSSL